MIEFVTLLLGLVTGVQAVEVSVSAGVARVELRLDGELAGSVDRAPWFINCDFGTELAPHELVAVAFDAGGGELGSVRQWVNLPRQRAEAHLILDRATAPRSARLIWTALDSPHPAAAIVSFDGKRLSVDDLEAIELPSYDPKSLHFLRVELLFHGAERLSTELVFGGSEAGEETWSELTAVPMLADKRPPEAEEMDGWLEKRGRPLRVAAVERGPVDLVVVRERSWAVQAGLELNHDRYLYERSNSRIPPVDVRVLDNDDRVRFVFPTTGRDRVDLGHGLVRQRTEQVPVSRPLRVNRRRDVRPPLGGGQPTELPSLFEILTDAFYEDLESPAPVQELADAVAIAGLTAAGDQRRAVILILSGDSTDSSRLTAAEVRGYLDKLRVPLFVWSIEAPAGSGDEDGKDPERVAAALAAWGPARDVSSRKTINEALDELRKALRSQVLVWLEGAHLAHEVELTGKAAGLRPAVDERPAPEPPVLDPEIRAADEERSAPAAPADVRIGPYPLDTVLDDGRLTAMLDRAAAGHRRLYAERYGVAVEGPIGGRVALFAAERDYLEFKRLQGHARAETEAAGYFQPPSLVVLQRGSHSRQEVTASLLHELTHLLNWRLLGGAGERDLPPWLEEGLAGDLALSSIGRQGLAAEPLGPGNLAYGRRLGDVLLEIDGKLDEGAAPSVEELLRMERAPFLAGEGELHYALSALWVRYLLDGGLAAPFRAWLAAVAAGGDAGPEALRSHLGRDWTRLEQGFRAWLDRQVRRMSP